MDFEKFIWRAVSKVILTRQSEQVFHRQIPPHSSLSGSLTASNLQDRHCVDAVHTTFLASNRTPPPGGRTVACNSSCALLGM
jgi:hypothetical protein